MEAQLRRFIRVLRILGASNFYNVSFSAYTIYLQGRYNSELLANLKKYKFKLDIRNDGYINITGYNIQITLT